MEKTYVTKIGKTYEDIFALQKRISGNRISHFQSKMKSNK